MKNSKVFVMVLLAAALTAGSVARAGDVVEQVVAIVNEQPIFLSELRKRATPYLLQLAEIPSQAQREAQQKELYKQLLDVMIDEKLIEAEAIKLDVKVTSEDIDRAVQNAMAQQQKSPEDFWDDLMAQGVTRKKYRAQMRIQLRQYKVINLKLRGRINITESQLRRVYKREKARSDTSPAYHAAHIFIGVEPDASKETWELALAGIKQERRRATAENFLAIAEEVGGGELGWLRAGDLSPELENAANKVKTGEISGPVKTEAGYHLIYVDDRKQGSFPAFEDIKPQLEQYLIQERMMKRQAQFIRALRRKSTIERRKLE